MRLAFAFVYLSVACNKSDAPKQAQQSSPSETVHVAPSTQPASTSRAAPSSQTPQPAVPFISREGHFRVAPPAGTTAHETPAGVMWDGEGRTFAVLYYDGKPRGVDRSSSYTAARDKLGDSAIDREERIVFDGHNALRRSLHVNAKSDGFVYRRNVILVVGDRTYDVSVSSTDRARTDNAETDVFFASFHTTDD
jgi:hypothetical protein